MMEWQPIETAPKDSTIVLLYGLCVDWASAGVTMGYFNEDYGWRSQETDGYNDPFLLQPTHWMPLPEPPK